MSAKHYDAAYAEFGAALDEWLGKHAPGTPSWRPGLAIASIGEATVTLIAKRDERIEALERRLAALEGDAK